jgi:hypothetical protein
MGVRATKEKKEYVQAYADSMGISVSDLIMAGVDSIINSTNPKISKELQRKHKAMQLRVKKLEWGKQIKEDNRDMFIVRNAMRSTIQMAQASKYLTGNINMEQIKQVIKNYFKLFSYFPPKIKRIIKGDVSALNKLTDLGELERYLGITVSTQINKKDYDGRQVVTNTNYEPVWIKLRDDERKALKEKKRLLNEFGKTAYAELVKQEQPKIETEDIQDKDMQDKDITTINDKDKGG